MMLELKFSERIFLGKCLTTKEKKAVNLVLTTELKT